MKVAIYPADHGGCGYYRMIWPAEALIWSGRDVFIAEPNSDQARIPCQMTKAKITYPGGLGDRIAEVVVGIEELPDADVVVIQRPGQRKIVELIAHLQAAGIAVVVELDDDFEHIDPRNSAAAKMNPKLSPDDNNLWMRMAVQRADVVTVSTPALARVYQRFTKNPIIVIPNRLPPHAYAEHPRTGPPAVFGWTGGINVHPNDLPVMGAAPQVALREQTFERFHVVGTGRGIAEQLGLAPQFVPKDPDEPNILVENPDWGITAVGEWKPITEYPTLMDEIDVGVVPLADTPFNAAKSWLKGLEFMGRGIPVVASALPEYLRLAENSGLSMRCVTKPKQWISALRGFADPDRYLLRSTAALAHARTYSIESHADDWWTAWELARAVRPPKAPPVAPASKEAGLVPVTAEVLDG